MSKRDPFKYYKTSPEIIKLAVMYYIRYPLSLRQVEDILHERGIDICHETIRYWWNKFGTLFSKEMKKKSLTIKCQIGGGISMKCSLKLMVNFIIYGAPLIKKEQS